MALSNVFREPRREITEQFVGLVTVAPFLWLDYEFAAWLERVSGPGPNYVPFPVGLILGICVLVVFLLLLLGMTVFIHVVGEGVCNAFERCGMYLRPRQRYQRR